jgi:hypothetical protein
MYTNINTDRNTAKNLAVSDVFIRTYTYTHPRNTSRTRTADVFSIPKTNSFSFGTALKTERFFAGQYSLKNTYGRKKISVRTEISLSTVRKIFLYVPAEILVRTEIFLHTVGNLLLIKNDYLKIDYKLKFNI